MSVVLNQNQDSWTSTTESTQRLTHTAVFTANRQQMDMSDPQLWKNWSVKYKIVRPKKSAAGTIVATDTVQGSTE